jgi:hypothetical protein
MATHSDMPEHNDVIGLLREIHHEQTRQGASIDELKMHVTGGTETAKGLAFRTAQLEARDESRTFWMRAIGTTAIGGLLTALGGLLFKDGSAH